MRKPAASGNGGMEITQKYAATSGQPVLCGPRSRHPAKILWFFKRDSRPPPTPVFFRDNHFDLHFRQHGRHAVGAQCFVHRRGQCSHKAGAGDSDQDIARVGCIDEVAQRQSRNGDADAIRPRRQPISRRLMPKPCLPGSRERKSPLPMPNVPRPDADQNGIDECR